MDVLDRAEKKSWHGFEIGLLLVCVLVTAAIAIPNFICPPHCRPPTRSACIANLKSIDGAKETWALEHQKVPGDIATDDDLFGYSSYIRERLVCTEGGKYILGAVGQKPRCAIPDHTF